MNPRAPLIGRAAGWAAVASLSFSLHCVQTPAVSPSADVPPATPPAPLDALASAAAMAPPPGPEVPSTASATLLQPSAADLPVPIYTDDPTWGSPAAPVTVVEFGDLECIYTAKVRATIAQLESDYGPEKLRIVWKHYPLDFHPHAKAASEAAQGVMALAGSDAFWRFYEMVLENQATLGQDRYVEWAARAGIPEISAYATGIAAHTWAPPVQRDIEQANAAGVHGTPTFFVNAVRMVGAYDLPALKAVVDRQLAAAAAKRAAGAPRARVYAGRPGPNCE